MYTVVHELKHIILFKMHSTPYLELPFQKQGSYREMLIERGFKVYMNSLMQNISSSTYPYIYIKLAFFICLLYFLGGVAI